jgi:hypothetical protein
MSQMRNFFCETTIYISFFLCEISKMRKFFVQFTICVSFLSETAIVEVFRVKLQLRNFSERPLNCYFLCELVPSA